MIERLVGTFAWRLPQGIILDVNGVGYGLEMTEPSLQRLPAVGENLELWVHTHVREDALKLYGFLSYEAKLLFGLFLSISGVGPKLAIGMLAHLDAPALLRAVHEDNAKILEDVPGIGPRQSKKILLEIKPKLEKMQAAGLLMNWRSGAQAATGLFTPETTPQARKGFAPTVLEDLQAALTNFGYKDKEFMPVIRRLEKDKAQAPLPELIRLALADLSGAARTLESRTTADEIF